MNNIPRAPILKEWIKQFLPDNPIILEAGAHIGRDTIKLSKVWPHGTIYAFEPVPELFAQLVERTRQKSNIHPIKLALSDISGKADMHVSTGASTAASSLLEPYEYKTQRPQVHFHPLEVETCRLDSWAAQQGLKAIDFLWLDMQGYELKVLQAAPLMLSTVKAILIEASLSERFKGNPLFDEVITWLEAHGFKALRHDEPKHQKVNIFFISKKLCSF